MGKRSGIIDHEEGLAKLSLAELDAEIPRCEIMRKIATTARGRKSLESRIHWLEGFRARHWED